MTTSTDQPTCRQCGAELVPQTNYCRKCGVAISAGTGLADEERTTALFDGKEIIATQRFDSRPTSPESPDFDLSKRQPKLSPTRVVLIGLVLLLLVAAIVSTVAVVKNFRHVRTASAEGFLYPGSRTTMDIVAAEGGRAVSLETSDSFDQVSHWYQAKLKAEKTIQLTEHSVVIKSGTTTVTIIGDEHKTTVLLKIIP